MIKIKFLSFILILAVFWIFWLPDIRVAPDLHLTQKSVQVNNIAPFVWKETAVADGLGEYYAPQLYSGLLHVFFGLLALLNLPFQIQIKLFGFLILLTGFWSIRKLLGKFEIAEPAKSGGAVFFLLNSFFLLLFDGGQLSLALAYSILPLSIYYLINFFEAGKMGDKVKFAASLLALSIADIRIVYLIFPAVLILIILKALFDFKNLTVYLRRLLTGGLLTAISLLGFHAYWLLPALSRGEIKPPPTYERTSQVNTLSFSTIGHSLLLQQPHWPQNVFGRISPLKVEFLIIPLLVFSALFLINKFENSAFKRSFQASLIKKKETAAFWLLLGTFGVFLSKGFNEPFGQIYSFLFTYIPGFAFFRDPAKFYFLLGLSYSILIALTLQHLSKRRVLAFVVIGYFIFLARPLYLNQMNGLFSEPLFKSDYEQLNKKLDEDKNFSRVVWIPSQAPLGLVSQTHPALGADRLSQKRPFAVGTKGTYETFNFLREAPYMGEIFDVAGIGYIVYPYPDPKRADMHPDNIKYYYTFLDQLSKRPWLSFENSGIPLFKTKEHQDRFFVTPKLWWIVGSDSILNEATKSAELKLAKNALIFGEEYAGLGARLGEFPEAKIVLNNKTQLDLAAGFLNPKDLIFPAKSLNFDPDKSGWWKREAADLVRWRSFLQDKYGIDNGDFDLGGGWAIGEGNLKLEIRNLKLEKDKMLLARVIESSRSGALKFYQGDWKIGEVSTKFGGDANVRWFEVGKLIAEKGLTIVSDGDINVINALAVLDQNEWTLFQDKAEKRKERIVNFSEMYAQSNNNPEVTYQRINSTKYKVKISNLTQPSFLVFSENYDALWKTNGQTPLPVYSLLNGYRIDRNGDYIIEFESQKYVYPGLVISGLTLTVLVLLLLI